MRIFNSSQGVFWIAEVNGHTVEKSDDEIVKLNRKKKKYKTKPNPT